MRNLRDGLLLTLVALALSMAIISCMGILAGCAASEVSLYAADMQACVARAQSKVEADDCRAGVKEKWHQKWRQEYPDAGF